MFALDAIQMPVSLHEPVYSDGGDTLYIMDQVSDKKKPGRKLGRRVVAGGGDGTSQ